MIIIFSNNNTDFIVKQKVWVERRTDHLSLYSNFEELLSPFESLRTSRRCHAVERERRNAKHKNRKEIVSLIMCCFQTNNL